MATMHPVYSSQVVFDTWLPVYVRNDLKISKCDTYEIMFIDSNQGCQIRNVNTKKLLKIGKNDYVSISTKQCDMTHVMLASAFPNISPQKTVDHIDNNPKNNHIFNLQWMSWADNARKSIEVTALSEKVGKLVLMKHESVIVGQFKSIEAAGRYIAADLTNQGIKCGHPTTIASKIREVTKGRRKKAYGFEWEESIHMDIYPDEIWKPLPQTNLRISNFGRVQGVYGDIHIGHKLRELKSRMMTVSLTNGTVKKMHVHQAVWIAFNGEIPEDMVVAQDPTAPLHADGGYRNWLVDLRLTTRSQIKSENEELRINPKKHDEIIDVVKSTQEPTVSFKRRNYNIKH